VEAEPKSLLTLQGGTDACQCADHVSGRYSHSLPDQPVADRRPRQADRACRRDHPRRDLVAEIYRGVLARSLAYKKSPGEYRGFSIAQWSSVKNFQVLDLESRNGALWKSSLPGN